MTEKTGRFCDVHQEWCPTGACRWCAPEEPKQTESVPVGAERRYVRLEVTGRSTSGGTIGEERPPPPPSVQAPVPPPDGEISVLEHCGRMVGAGILGRIEARCGCGWAVVVGSEAEARVALENHQVRHSQRPRPTAEAVTPSMPARADAGPWTAEEIRAAKEERMLKIGRAVNTDIALIEEGLRKLGELPRPTFMGVPIAVDPSLGPDEWRLVPHVDAPRLRAEMDAALFIEEVLGVRLQPWQRDRLRDRRIYRTKPARFT